MAFDSTKLGLSTGVTPKVVADTPAATTPVTTALVEKPVVKNQSVIVVAENTFETAAPARASDLSGLRLPGQTIGARRDAGGKLENAGTSPLLAQIAANLVPADADLSAPGADVRAEVRKHYVNVQFKDEVVGKAHVAAAIAAAGPKLTPDKRERYDAMSNADLEFDRNSNGSFTIGDRNVSNAQREQRINELLTRGVLTRDNQVIHVTRAELEDFYDRKERLLAQGPELTVTGRKWVTQDFSRRAQVYAEHVHEAVEANAAREALIRDASSTGTDAHETKPAGVRDGEARKQQAENLGESAARTVEARLEVDSERRDGLKQQIDAAILTRQAETRARSKA